MGKQWHFEKYAVYEEGCDRTLRFEDTEGNVLGYVVAGDNADHNANVEALDGGANPIDERWEDGDGNTVSLGGWGEYEKSDTQITVETNQAENYFYASEALEDEGYKEVGIAYTTDGDFEIYRKDGEEFYFVGMTHFNSTISEVYLEPLEKLNYYNKDYHKI